MSYSHCRIAINRVSLAINASSLALAHVWLSVMECVRVVRHASTFAAAQRGTQGGNA